MIYSNRVTGIRADGFDYDTRYRLLRLSII